MGRIKQLKEMGFSESVARKVLGECGWDVNRAIDRLLLEGVPEEDVFPAEEVPPLPASCGPAWQPTAPTNRVAMAAGAQDGTREEAGIASSRAEEPQPRLPPLNNKSNKEPAALATWPLGQPVLPPPSSVTRPPPPKAGPPPPKPNGSTAEQTPHQQAVARTKTDKDNLSDEVSTLDPDAAAFKPLQPQQPMHPAEVARPWRQQLVEDEKQRLSEVQGWAAPTASPGQPEKQPDPFPTRWGTLNLADAIIPNPQQSLNEEAFRQEYQMTEQQEQSPQQHQPHYSATPQQPEQVQEVQQVQQQESISEPHTPKPVPPPAPCLVKVKEAFDGKGLEVAYGGRKFLKVNVGDEIGLISWNYMGSGWSFARQHRGGWNSQSASPNVRPPPGLEDELVKEGWIPRDCLEYLDVHVVSHNWEETPEHTRPYLKLTCGEKVLVEQRYESGWWYGYGIRTDGMLSDKKGYFPANFCTAGAAA